VIALVRDAWRDFGWNRLRASMLLGVGVTAWNSIVWLQSLVELAETMPVWMQLQALLGDQIRALVLTFAIAVADRAVDDGAPRRRAYALAAMLGCVAGVAASLPLHWAWRTWVMAGLWPPDWTWAQGTAGEVFWPIFWFTQWLPVGCAVVFLHAHRRAAGRTARILHAAELDRIRRSRIALESRLQAMQARVEPLFLFNTLAQVERLFGRDRLVAARMLDDLIAYLRAAMPMMRGTSSTVAREVELARAYLDIVRAPWGARLQVAIDVGDEARAASMPPMMLLPLVDHAVARGLAAATDAGAIAIAAEIRSGRLRMSVVDCGAGPAPDRAGQGIDALRQRLDALFGSAATLDFEPAGERATEAVLDLPLRAREYVDDDPETTRR